jgi:hypothetical protein
MPTLIVTAKALGYNGKLLNKIERYLGVLSGEVEIHVTLLPDEIIQELNAWLRSNPTAWRGDYNPAPGRLIPPRTAPEPVEQIDIDAEFKADLQARVDEASAQARMEQYVAEQNLEPSDHNMSAVAGWIRQNLKGYWSSAGVDAAIANLGPRGTNVLRWQPKVGALVLPAQESGEVLEILPNGEKQLSIKEPPPKSASPTQAKDWLARYRTANNLIFNKFGR